MRRKALINLISCVLSIAIIIGSGIFAFSKLYEKEKEIVPEQKQETAEVETAVAQPQVEEKTTSADEQVTKKAEAAQDNSSSKKVESVTSAPKTAQPQVTRSAESGDNSSEQAARKEAGTLGFLWDPLEKVFYSASDPWQRNFGYNALYDLAAPYIVLYYDTLRVKFNYGGYDWLVQFWKGQYGFVLLGAEVGVYYKPEGTSIEHYICNDNNMRLKVGYTCYDKGEVIFTRKYQDTWWLTGFVEGKLDFFNDRSEMAMEIRISLNGYEMRDSFVEGLKKCGFKSGNANFSQPDTYYTNGTDVHIFWQNISQL
ncbi:MAG: DUF4474 domain-containing protein [Clostridia bacterium]|nr:DUF4474 domain-containing protein [Clostridia bacterium]